MLKTRDALAFPEALQSESRRLSKDRPILRTRDVQNESALSSTLPASTCSLPAGLHAICILSALAKHTLGLHYEGGLIHPP